jgi:hypothetical protein
MNDFLPKGYETPESESRFMEFAEGTNTFRILSPAIVGYKWWEDTGNGDRVPRRVRTEEDVPEGVRNAPDERDAAKHFWAFLVYNYDTQSIQVLELKQKSIMRAIEAYTKNPKWGNPQGYDLLIEKVKTGSRDRDVKYNVIPEPPTKLDAGIAELASNVPVNLEALYEGKDPFAVTESGEADDERNGSAHRRQQGARRVHTPS